MGVNPGSPGSHPGQKAALKRPATRAAHPPFFKIFLNSFIHRDTPEREREAETQAEGEAGSMHREPDMGFDPGSPGSRPGPKAAPNRWATRAAQDIHFKYLFVLCSLTNILE